METVVELTPGPTDQLVASAEQYFARLRETLFCKIGAAKARVHFRCVAPLDGKRPRQIVVVYCGRPTFDDLFTSCYASQCKTPPGPFIRTTVSSLAWKTRAFIVCLWEPQRWRVSRLPLRNYLDTGCANAKNRERDYVAITELEDYEAEWHGIPKKGRGSEDATSSG